MSEEMELQGEKLLKKYFIYLWTYIFSVPWLSKVNRLLFLLSLRGLGILNYETDYFSGEIAWLKKYLSNEKNIIFDVGANVGNYANKILNLSQDAELYAFEPHPKNFIKLKKVDKIFAFNLAIGDQNSKISLYDYGDKDGSAHASLYQEVIEDLHRANSVCHTVDMITLDDFCAEYKVSSIDFLKIDTEGNELKVLMGAQRMLQAGSIKAIQFEFNSMNLISQTTFKDFWDLLKDFNIYRLLPGGRLLEIKSYSSVYCEIYAYQNIIALRRG